MAARRHVSRRTLESSPPETMGGKDGGKAKPLKAAKKAEKEYDDGACARSAAARALCRSARALPQRTAFVLACAAR